MFFLQSWSRTCLYVSACVIDGVISESLRNRQLSSSYSNLYQLISHLHLLFHFSRAFLFFSTLFCFHVLSSFSYFLSIFWSYFPTYIPLVYFSLTLSFPFPFFFNFLHLFPLFYPGFLHPWHVASSPVLPWTWWSHTADVAEPGYCSLTENVTIRGSVCVSGLTTSAPLRLLLSLSSIWLMPHKETFCSSIVAQTRFA